MNDKYHYRRICTREGCRDYTTTAFASQREYADYCKKAKDWACIRHRNVGEILSHKNNKTIQVLYCRLKREHKYWQKEENSETDNMQSGFQYGNGYKAFAEDFPVGTKLTITAKISL